jgi:heme exporter protein D
MKYLAMGLQMARWVWAAVVSCTAFFALPTATVLAQDTVLAQEAFLAASAKPSVA